MKRLLTAAAAFALLSGSYALAQTEPPSAPADGGTPPAASAPMDPSATTPAAPMAPAAPTTPADPGAATPTPPAADTSAAPAPAADAGVTANAPSAAPASYPACKTKSEDRCTQTGKMMKSAGHKHHAMHKKMAKMKMKATAPADAAATPAAPQ